MSIPILRAGLQSSAYYSRGKVYVPYIIIFMHRIFDGTRPFDQNILFLTRVLQEKNEEQTGRINARSVYKSWDKLFDISFIIIAWDCHLVRS